MTISIAPIGSAADGFVRRTPGSGAIIGFVH